MTIGEMTPGEIVDYNGRPARVARNGALQDVQSGRIVAPPPVDAIGSPERARELNYIRWHGEAQAGYRRALQSALAERNDSRVIETIEQARGAGVEIMAGEIAFNAGVREDWRIKAHEHALEQSGMDGRAPRQAAPPAGGVQISIGADVAAQIMAQLMDMAQQRDILDVDNG